MQKINFNKDWYFTLENNLDAFNVFGFAKYREAGGAPSRHYKNPNWQKVNVPHDWAITLAPNKDANTFAGAFPNTFYHRFMTHRKANLEEVFNTGWYRKEFFVDEAFENKRVFLEFEGVFRDAMFWINGSYIDRHTSGYTSFVFEITDHLVKGENCVAVRVDSSQPEGWFYEGAGIYRNVNMLVGESVYFKKYKTFVKSCLSGKVDVSAILVNDTQNPVSKSVVFEIKDKDNNTVCTKSQSVEISPFEEKHIECDLHIDNVNEWSVDSPYLYTLNIDAEDKESVTFGIREFEFDSDKGFFLNGKPLKIRGACVHQDFGGVGVALSDNLNEYKIAKLKEMGVNAYRCSHNPPSPSLLDACDRLGMLVMDEARMFGSSPEAIRQLESLVERDRNHASVFIWCIGNEEVSVQWDGESGKIAEKMMRVVNNLDGTRKCTYGGNNSNTHIGVNSVVDVRGINYIRANRNTQWVDTYHKEHPQTCIIGTEEGSHIQSCIDSDNDVKNLLVDCSGNVAMPWGCTHKEWVTFYEQRPWMCGGFMWTGFDYHGEPNPYLSDCNKSFFGVIDLFGGEKPPFYYYKSWWTDEPVLKLAPHWNYKKGKKVKVYVYTNCDEVELFVNNKFIDKKSVSKYDLPTFEVEFEEGILSVKGIKDGKEYSDTIKTSGNPEKLIINQKLCAKTNDDINIYEIKAVDKDGNVCPICENSVEISLENGSLEGFGNSNPRSFDAENRVDGEKALFIKNFRCDGKNVKVGKKIGNALWRRRDYFREECDRIVADFDNLGQEKEYTLTLKMNDVKEYEYIEFERIKAQAQIFVNGEKVGDNFVNSREDWTRVRPYRFYCDFKNGENVIEIKAKTDEKLCDILSGYVKLARAEKKPERVKLYGGKAYVLTRNASEDDVVVTFLK